MAKRAGKGSAIARVRARQFRVLPECSSPSSETLALKLQAMRESVNRLYHRPEPGEMQLARWSDLMAEAEAQRQKDRAKAHEDLSAPELHPSPAEQKTRSHADRRGPGCFAGLLQGWRKALAALRGDAS